MTTMTMSILYEDSGYNSVDDDHDGDDELCLQT